MKHNRCNSKNPIKKVEVTRDTITGRGGLALFQKYLHKVEIFPILEDSFGSHRKSMKGLPIWAIFKQIFCWFFDGTSRHLSYFDQLKTDEGYAAVIESDVDGLVSSHQLKRFFKSFSLLTGKLYRKILQRLFVWRLKMEQPAVIELMLDTMVMDNDYAEKRHGVQPTYKKKKGFQPIQLIWKNKIVDAIFRGGSKHSNCGNTVINMMTDIVHLIRKEYSETATIVLRIDSGFFDEKNFKAFDALGIAFICSGKMYKGVKEHVGSQPESAWKSWNNGRQEWSYIEFGYRCESWCKFYRAIYTRPIYEGNQGLLDFARPDNVIVTNIGVNSEALIHLDTVGRKKYSSAESIIHSHHQRGADELPHRGLKDFGFQELPFKRFLPNASVYYCMLISFFLFETFKEDILDEVLPIGSYASTVRRKLLDCTAKIVCIGREIILKVSKAVIDNLRFDELWLRCQTSMAIF
jgi:Transposase DDE domain group 1